MKRILFLVIATIALLSLQCCTAAPQELTGTKWAGQIGSGDDASWHAFYFISSDDVKYFSGSNKDVSDFFSGKKEATFIYPYSYSSPEMTIIWNGDLWGSGTVKGNKLYIDCLDGTYLDAVFTKR